MVTLTRLPESRAWLEVENLKENGWRWEEIQEKGVLQVRRKEFQEADQLLWLRDQGQRIEEVETTLSLAEWAGQRTDWQAVWRPQERQQRMCSGDASMTGQVPFSAGPSATLEKAESWIHSELGAG